VRNLLLPRSSVRSHNVRKSVVGPEALRRTRRQAVEAVHLQEAVVAQRPAVEVVTGSPRQVPARIPRVLAHPPACHAPLVGRQRKNISRQRDLARLRWECLGMTRLCATQNSNDLMPSFCGLVATISATDEQPVGGTKLTLLQACPAHSLAHTKKKQLPELELASVNSMTSNFSRSPPRPQIETP
jgi:hypothetical protein